MPAPSGVNNIFSLLDEDDNENDDGFTVVAKTAKPAAKPAKAEEAKTQPRERKSKTERPPRGEKGGDRRGPRAYDGEDKPTKPESEEGRKGGKGRDRGDRAGKGGKKGGRREFDRHSGTGRGKGSSRDGHGKYNWGEKTDGAQEENADGADNENKAPAEAPPVEIEEEEEDNTMSFEEYMKAKAEQKSVGPKLNVRTVENKDEGFEYKRGGDGSEDAQAGLFFHDYDGKDKSHEEKEAREGWVVADAVLNMKFVDPNAGAPSGSRGKGGKKGGRNDRNDRGGRGKGQSRPQQGKIELSDTQAFPSLG